MFGNPKGELRICPKCKREHDILRGTRCWCACGKEIRSKEFEEKEVSKVVEERLEKFRRKEKKITKQFNEAISGLSGGL